MRLLLTKPAFMVHNRLVALVIAVNVILFPDWLGIVAESDQLEFALTAMAANLTSAVVIRQQYVVNALFALAVNAPRSWPLSIRSALAKVYHFGGIHVGASTAATAWFTLAIAIMLTEWSTASPPTRITACVLAAVLLLIVGFALPPVRRRWHDLFEASHRFGGWTALLLIIALMILHARDAVPANADAFVNTVDVLVTSVSSWLLLLTIVCVALPWTRLRRVPVSVTVPSSHVALATFGNERSAFAGSSTSLARAPLGQWHSFANIVSPGVDGFRLTISRAGDWSGAFIDDMPNRVWVKGIATAGVGNVDALFSKVVWVATGSGIGPCLPHLLSGATPSKLVWATRDPRRTYGSALVDEIIASQPEATIWDTSTAGKPDLVELALSAVAESGAEAVICISNQPTTRHVVESLESRGIPAYGAIWDS